jgi:GNAT superfamily N-acetyltransferase
MADLPLNSGTGADARADSAVPLVRLSDERLPDALQLSQALKWPYRLDDWRDALRLGHGVAVEVDGRIRATALWWPWGDRFATCGMIIVDDALQGRGIGAAFMRELIRLAQDRTLLLRSTVAGRRLYERCGFVPFGHVHQHQATLAATPAGIPGAGGRWMRDGESGTLVALDADACGMDRRRLLDAVFANGRVVVAERGERLAGYACVRRWGRGFVIGPVVADDVGGARALIAAVLREHVGDFVRIDVTEDSALSHWLEELGLPRVDRVTSMARGPLPPQSGACTVFALASQSLG